MRHVRCEDVGDEELQTERCVRFLIRLTIYRSILIPGVERLYKCIAWRYAGMTLYLKFWWMLNVSFCVM